MSIPVIKDLYKIIFECIINHYEIMTSLTIEVKTIYLSDYFEYFKKNNVKEMKLVK